MASPSKCEYPGCGTELKPLFNSLYCPNEENHGKKKISYGKLGITEEILNASVAPLGIHPFIPQCYHPAYVRHPNGLHECYLCGTKSMVPFP